MLLFALNHFPFIKGWYGCETESLHPNHTTIGSLVLV